MYFNLNEDQKAIAESVESLLRDRIPEDKAVAIFDAGSLHAELWADVSQMGFGGMLVPDNQNGLGLDLVTLAAVQEKIGWAAASVPLAENALAAWLIATAGNKNQSARWVDALATGRSIAAFALAERDAIDPDGWQFAGPVLGGEKPFVAWGAEADVLIVGGKGGALYLIESSAAGVSSSPVASTDLSRPLATIVFEGAEAELLTEDAAIVRSLMDAIFVLLAADACGAGNRALELAVSYAKIRKQFDRLIGSFQGVKHQLADLASEMEPARYLVWYAAHAWDAIPTNQSYAAALAKAHLGEVAVRTARGAVELHGGIGFTWEYPLHVYLKRAMFDRSALGLPAMHRARSATLAGW